MIHTAQSDFFRQYGQALRGDLDGARKEGAANAIGLRAIDLGMVAADLAGAHGRALTALAGPPSEPVVSAKSLARAGRFLVAALVPLDRNQAAARRAGNRIVLAQEEERRAISHELHDEVGQVLAAVTLRLAGLTETSALSSRNLRHVIAETQRVVERSLKVVHRFARELRPALLDDLGLVPSLRSYIRDLPGRGKLRIRFRATADLDGLDNLRRTVLYRVAQQALSNVVRHAEASEAVVVIRQAGAAVLLEVTDDGKAFSAAGVLNGGGSGRLGLIGMRERVEMIGGVFTVKSVSGMGTSVRALIPLSRRRR